MDFRLPKQTYDFDAWLSEDLTEEYDRIIRERKRRRILRRWAAAAAIIGTIFILGITLNPGNTKSDEKLPTASTSEPRVEPSGSLPGAKSWTAGSPQKGGKKPPPPFCRHPFRRR